MNPITVAVVYTTTAPQLIAAVETALREELGSAVTIKTYQEERILQQTVEAGYVTSWAAARLMELYSLAIQTGADVILNACSSVGSVADSAQDFAAFAGVPILRIDEEMCRDAVRAGRRIGVMATLSSTLLPTRETILRVAREMGTPDVELHNGLVDGAFGLSQEKLKESLLQAAKQLEPAVDCILLAQGSMAYAHNTLQQQVKVPILSSPVYGAKEVKKALVRKGLIL